MPAGLVEVRRKRCFWGVVGHQGGFLQEGASGDRLWAQGCSQQRDGPVAARGWDVLLKGQLKVHGEGGPRTLDVGCLGFVGGR